MADRVEPDLGHLVAWKDDPDRPLGEVISKSSRGRCEVRAADGSTSFLAASALRVVEVALPETEGAGPAPEPGDQP